MRNLIILWMVLAVALSVAAQSKYPDLSNKEDLRALGTGKILERDNSIIKKIILNEVGEYWIVYIKNESMHDLMMEKISQIDFLDSKWGPLKMRFPNNKPEISRLETY